MADKVFSCDVPPSGRDMRGSVCSEVLIESHSASENVKQTFCQIKHKPPIPDPQATDIKSGLLQREGLVGRLKCLLDSRTVAECRDLQKTWKSSVNWFLLAAKRAVSSPLTYVALWSWYGWHVSKQLPLYTSSMHRAKCAYKPCFCMSSIHSLQLL